MNLESYQKKIHYNVMGIGLAVLARKKDSHLFKILDEALTTLDWVSLHKIGISFATLSGRDQAMILIGGENPVRLCDAISRLEMKVYLDELWQEMRKDLSGNGIVHLN
ncbi:MAG: hypothetical protein V3S64_02145 [bacterium]